MPTTKCLRHVWQGEWRGDGGRSIAASAHLLRNIHLAGMPDTDAIERQHELLTRRFGPRVDVTLS